MIHVILGIVLLVVAAGTGMWLLAVGGAALLATGALGWCGIYHFLGISTCPIEAPKK